MTDDVRNLIRFVVDGDIRNAQTQCRIMLEKNVPEKDARFKENELRKLNLLKPELIQLPANLESLLIAEDATNFLESRFLLREEEETVINAGENVKQLRGSEIIENLVRTTPVYPARGVP